MCRNDLILEAARDLKLIVCDLDGTLLNSQKTISPANLAAIEAVRKRGILFTVCTGRIPEMTEAYTRLLEIQGFYIAANGAVIFDTRDSSMPYRECVDTEDARQLLEFCKRRGFDHIAATLKGCYYSEGSDRLKRFEQYNEIAGKDNLRQIPLFPFNSDYRKVKEMQIYKLLISGLSAKEQLETEQYMETLPRLSFTSSEPKLLDIIAPGANKGTGVQNLARLLGISKKQICVFGDYHNDIPMFDAAGFSVAMGNADDTVKNRAAVITGTNDEDGVARVIEKYFLGG